MRYTLVARDEQSFLRALLTLVKTENESGFKTKTSYSGNPSDGYIGFIETRKEVTK